jgi:hypothetical protein
MINAPLVMVSILIVEDPDILQNIAFIKQNFINLFGHLAIPYSFNNQDYNQNDNWTPIDQRKVIC